MTFTCPNTVFHQIRVMATQGNTDFLTSATENCSWHCWRIIETRIFIKLYSHVGIYHFLLENRPFPFCITYFTCALLTLAYYFTLWVITPNCSIYTFDCSISDEIIARIAFNTDLVTELRTGWRHNAPVSQGKHSAI